MKRASTDYEAPNSVAAVLTAYDSLRFPKGSMGRRWAALWMARHGVVALSLETAGAFAGPEMTFGNAPYQREGERP